MAEQGTPAPDGVTAGTAAPAADAAAPAQDGIRDEQDFRKAVYKMRDQFGELANAVKQLAGNAKPDTRQAPASADANVAALQAKMAKLEAADSISRVASDRGVSLSYEQRQELVDLHEAQGRPADMAEWFSRKAQVFSLGKAVAAPTVPTPAVPVAARPTGDPGAPGRAPGAVVPDDPRQIDPQVWAAYTTQERNAKTAAFRQQSGNGRIYTKPLPGRG